MRRSGRVPFIPQMEQAECGAACLAMVLARHGHHAPLPEVRLACGVSRDGASAAGLLRAEKPAIGNCSRPSRTSTPRPMPGRSRSNGITMP